MRKSITAVALFGSLTAFACGGGEQGQAGGEAGLSGAVRIDGSSTVFPITEAVAEEFQRENSEVRVTVGISGTGGGFKKFCSGETDISDASRQIKDTEIEACAAEGIEPIEITVGYDGLAVMVNPANDFVDCLTVDELKRIWEPGSQVTTWQDVRSFWPAEEIKLYGPGTDSGTFDYFTEAIVGEEDASRPDFTASEDDNVLVQGVTGDRYSLGYFGYAYYAENTDKLKLVAVDGGAGCVAPAEATVKDGTYAPLSRPLFIYVKEQSLQRPEVMAFVEYTLMNAAELVPQVGYVALGADSYQASLSKIK
ncbi:MAG: PstS family phosphate ABC transporter substrate-binding protein [Gemmatimonadota bacterium]|nr:MAG: PstS family phosphate ABC transporter substrate-binding protein [Gemmatimonadota bacterium]